MNSQSRWLRLILALAAVGTGLWLLNADGTSFAEEYLSFPLLRSEEPVTGGTGEKGRGQPPTIRPGPSSATLTGRVISSGGGGVRGAEVYLVAPGADVVPVDSVIRGLTDEDGGFSLPMPLGRSVDLVVQKDGYRPGLEAGLLLSAPGERREVRITLESGVAIEGTVTDREGGPLEGALVRALGPDATPPRISPEARLGSSGLRASFAFTRTDEQGRFRLSGLQSNLTYHVDARKAGWLPLTLSRQVYPSVKPPELGLVLQFEPLSYQLIQLVGARTGEPIESPLVRFEHQGGAPLAVPGVHTREWDYPPYRTAGNWESVGTRLGGGLWRFCYRLPEGLDPETGEEKYLKPLYRISAPGYVPRLWAHRVSPTSPVDPVTIELQTAGGERGCLEISLSIQPDSAPPEMPVTLLLTAPNGEHYTWHCRAPKEARILFSDLPVGNWRIEMPTFSALAQIAGTLQPRSVEVTAEAKARARLSIEPGPAHPSHSRLVIDVRDTKGNPLPYSQVHLQVSRKTGGMLTHLMLWDNRFSGPLSRHDLSLPEGILELQVSRVGYHGSPRSGRTVGGKTVRLYVVLEKAKTPEE